PNEDFMRMLRLSGLDSDGMTDDQRDALVNMAENLGIDPGDAEDLVDLYLEEIEKNSTPAPPKAVSKAPPAPTPANPVDGKATTADLPGDTSVEQGPEKNSTNAIGVEMIGMPAGVFRMGSEAPDAAPNE